jgi:membrane protease subunit HflK
MAGSGGPWGGGGKGPDDDERNGRDKDGNRNRPGEGPTIPEIDRLVKKGQDQLRVLMGGRGSGNGGGVGRRPQGDGPPSWLNRQSLVFGVVAALLVWSYASFYTVKPEEHGVELVFGKFLRVTNEGLNFAPWPVVSAEIVQTSGQRTTSIGTGQGGDLDNGLMLTGDQNIVDIEFQVVWNIKDPAKFLFNLADPEGTIRAVSESAMRDIIARSQLAPVLNRDRGAIAAELMAAVQATLDRYDAGINIIRVNFDRADPPAEVIDAFRQVQAAQQQRDQLEKQAEAYANTKTAAARGTAAQLAQEAEAYRAQVVNQAQGDASRFLSVYAAYIKAPGVTRERMYLETMEKVLGGLNKVILSSDLARAGGGVLPWLPLDGVSRMQPAATPQALSGAPNNSAGGSN